MRVAILIGCNFPAISDRDIAITKLCIELSSQSFIEQRYPDPEQWRGRGKRKMRKPK